MIIGYDTCHDSQIKGKNVGVCVFSMDENLTKWYSQSALHEDSKEMVNNIRTFFISTIQYKKFTWKLCVVCKFFWRKDGFKKFHERNGTLPERVMYFRDGVAEGMTPVIYLHELPTIKEVFKQFSLDYKFLNK